MQQEQRSASQARLAAVSAEVPRGATPPAQATGSIASTSVLRERIAFLRGFVANPAQVGSVIPSSHFLEQRLVRCAELSDAQCVVELGPGMGGTTRAMLGALPAGARLLAIELNADFAARLQSTLIDPRLSVVQGSAEDIEHFLTEHRLPPPDAIVSGIPFSTMPAPVADRIAGEIARLLAPEGRFVAYQVRAAVAAYAIPYLGHPHKEWEWVNIPPVQVFTWTRHEGQGRRRRHRL